ncbi:NAD-dependent epimerase/dehydratase family protein [Enterococcus gallinarum]|jgi:UDP-glucose 4-epimerase|uniref:NAD-dependent epimerase/dehydratase family protein n=1 Tax=Enterococcus TaxID=1350 RepID=UPI001C60DB0C|nr:NAD-dependent epimerase/dehydratase family protein [Enterococcus gallinarum]MBW5473398.1 NAD-dependent epimerase/dehydratase family protein [Enterococcus gallinarum]MDT2728347.1 NAD-dependent epimerase/dehydratase family protein [Enterococcus gallinarum]UJA23554.1 NAD-dependent epimerase/dehydratase family protein [Enterococcus gallinarum]
MRYLVTGGAGFIGSTLVNNLEKNNNEIVVIDNLSMGKRENLNSSPKITFFEKDVRNRDFVNKLFAEYQFDYIFHLAAVASVADSIERPFETHQVNMEATLDLLELAKETQKNLKRFVFASSAAVYGDDQVLPKSEISRIKPLSPYAIDKYSSEQYVLLYNTLYGLPTSAVRFFNVYGPNQNPSSPYSGVLSIITNHFKKIRNNEKDVFTIFGDGSQTRDFVYVEDVLQALKLVSEKEEALGEVFNVGTGAPSSINDVLGIYESEMNIKPIIQFEESRKGDIKDSVADISKLKKIGFSPNYSLDEGIAKYLSTELK